LLVWKTAGMPILVGAYFLLGGFRASRSLMTAQIEKMVNSANLGLAYGFLETAIGLAMAVAPPIAGALYARNPFLIFRISLFLLIPIILFTLFRRKTLWNT
jgi:MFS family permease